MLKKKLEQAESTTITSKSITPPKKQKINNNNEETGGTSKYFTPSYTLNDFQKKYLYIQDDLNTALCSIQFSAPVAHIYNPLTYASQGNELYVAKYCKGPKKVLFMGMNPGPFGMCQTGVPFGEIKAVRDWLGICCNVSQPKDVCPKRPIQGFDCERTEVSGDRWWNLLKKICKTPENFFRNCFLYNYCPLAMMKADGCNVTPSDIKVLQERKKLEEVCDLYCYQIIELLEPDIIVAIGSYVKTRANAILKKKPICPQVLVLTHPSPRVLHNQDWPQKAEKFFQDNNLMPYFQE